MHELTDHGHALDRHSTVADLAARWLDDAGGRLKPKTMQGYRSQVSASILPILGNRAIADLKPSDVRRLHSSVFAKKVGAASVAGAHRALSAMLSFAVDEGLIARNVAASVDIPRQPPAARDSLSRSEAHALMALGDPRWMLALLSGARDGELRALRIEDMELDRNVVHISWNLAEVTSLHGCGGTCGTARAARCPQRVLDIAPNLEAEPLEGRWALVRPKSYKPRTVPITQVVARAIRAHIDGDIGPNPHGLVWHRPDGGPYTNADSNAIFRSALASAGIRRPASTHWLRHTYTTMAEHAGIPWVVYAGVSGHSSEEVSRRYTHQLEQEARSGIERLDQFLRRQ